MSTLRVLLALLALFGLARAAAAVEVDSKGATCAGDLVNVPIAASPGVTNTVSVTVPRVNARMLLVMTSTIQADTATSGALRSRIAVVDSNGNTFFAHPSDAAFVTSVPAGQAAGFTTGVWFLETDKIATVGFTPGTVTVIRQDQGVSAGADVEFKSLCVEKQKL